MDKSKTIWIINQYAAPLEYSHFGARHLYFAKEYLKAGYQVYIITCTYNHYIHKSPPKNKQFNFEDVDGVTFIWVKGFEYKNSNGIERVISWITFSLKLFFLPWKKLGKPEIIIVSSVSILPVLNAIWLKYRYKAKKFIFEIRDIWPETFIELGNHSKYHPLALFLGFFEKMGYKKANHIVATMPKADLHISSRIKKKFDFKCIPQGIDKQFFSKQLDLPAEFIRDYIPSNKFIVGYAGTIGLSNALSTLLEAAKELMEKNQEIHFLLLGDGHDKASLMKSAENLKNVTFIPKIASYYIQSFLKKCNILYDSVLSVNLYKYGISRNKWMDYLYSNKPIIVSYSGYDNLLEETKSGIIVPSEDHLRLIDAILHIKGLSKEELLKMENGREYVLKNRTYETLALEYLELFK